jgi:hypothetical protein
MRNVLEKRIVVYPKFPRRKRDNSLIRNSLTVGGLAYLTRGGGAGPEADEGDCPPTIFETSPNPCNFETPTLTQSSALFRISICETVADIQAGFDLFL